MGLNSQLRIISETPMETLCSVWMKLAHWVWRIIYLKVVNLFSLFGYRLTLEKDMARNLSFYHPRMPGLVEIDPVVLEKKRTMLKFTHKH